MTRTVLSGGRVFDGTGSPIADADIVISDGKIVNVGPGLDGDEQVDVSGLTILPGFFDCHVHVMASGIDLVRRLQRPFSYQFFQAAKNLEATLDCGITTIRDAGGADLGVQRAVEDGLIDGPRLQIAISALSQTGGHGDGWLPSGITTFLMSPHPGRPPGLADGPEEVRKRVREIIRAGANVIKVHTSGGVLSPRDSPKHAQFQPDELSALMAEATAAGLPVMAHAQATDGIKNALRAGVRSIEHGIYLDDEAIEMMLRNQAWLVPTLVAPHSVLNAASAGSQLPDGVAAKAREVIDAHASSFARAVAAGCQDRHGHGQRSRSARQQPRRAAADGRRRHDPGPGARRHHAVRSRVAPTRRRDRHDHAWQARRPGRSGRRSDFDLASLKTNVKTVYKAGLKVRG